MELGTELIEGILKKSLFPELVKACWDSASNVWQYNKLAAIILYFAGFILTVIGNFILIPIIVLITLKRKKII